MSLRAMRSGLCAAGTATLVFALAACGEVAHLPVTEGAGPSPALPRPPQALTSGAKIAPEKGRPSATILQAAPDTSVLAFARDLDHPRWLYVLPNGDVLVAETNATSRADGAPGIRGWLTGRAMKPAGSGVPSANRITLLRDADGDGVAELRSVLIESVNSPFSMALVGDQLYVAALDAVLRFPYVAGATRILDPGIKVVDLPAGAIHHDWARNPIPGGLLERNGLAREPRSGALRTVVKEIAGFDGNLVPDPTTSVRDGVYFGWPYRADGHQVAERVAPPRSDSALTAIAPDHAPDARIASRGWAASRANALPANYPDGMFVGQPGSWERRSYSGYQVIFVPFANERSGEAPFGGLTGFVTGAGDAFGRPAGVFLDNQGALLVADDVGNVIWRVALRR